MALLKYPKKTLFSVFFIAWSLTTDSAGSLPETCPNLADIPRNQINAAVVDWIADGDTLHTKSGDKLRLLHIDSPEINATKNKPAQPFSQQAKSKLQSLIGNSNQVYWTSDKKEKDKYHRTLAFVFNKHGHLLNAQLVKAGMARSLIISPNKKYWRCILDAENSAIQNSKGIWTNHRLQSTTATKATKGYQRIRGKITQTKVTKKYRWYILDGVLWIGVPRNRWELFD